jgi:predicted dehydrogenase
VDVVPERADEVASQFGVRALTDYRQLPRYGVQCASVVTDTVTHAEIAGWLLEHGIDVLVEKPFAQSVADAERLIGIAARNGRILQVGHLERFNPAFRAMKEVLTEPRFFEARRITPFTGRGSDVGVTLDLMIHDIDIIAHLAGRPLVKVEAIGVPVMTNTIDIANARLTFEGGAVANVTASRAAFTNERTLRVFQPDVYISLDYGKRKLKIYRRLQLRDEKGFQRLEVSEHDVEERDALQDEIVSFLTCVETRVEPEVGARDGLRALELAGLINSKVEEAAREFHQVREFPAPAPLRAGNE